MKIRKSNQSHKHLTMVVSQPEFRYWDGFCEFFIQKCEQVVQNNNIDRAEATHFQALKETLELILFTIDINQTDRQTIIEFESTYLAFFISMKERWIALLQQNIRIKQGQLTSAKNGENKRHFYDEIEKNIYYVNTGERLLLDFANFINSEN